MHEKSALLFSHVTKALFYTEIGEPRRLLNFLTVQTIYEIIGEKVAKQVNGAFNNNFGILFLIIQIRLCWFSILS